MSLHQAGTYYIISLLLFVCIFRYMLSYTYTTNLDLGGLLLMLEMSLDF